MIAILQSRWTHIIVAFCAGIIVVILLTPKKADEIKVLKEQNKALLDTIKHSDQKIKSAQLQEAFWKDKSEKDREDLRTSEAQRTVQIRKYETQKLSPVVRYTPSQIDSTLAAIARQRASKQRASIASH